MSNSLCVNLYGKTMSQPLPAKELSTFKSLLKLLDQKQYKKALKSIDGILKKCPDHGETLAMKAFTIRSQFPEKKDESYEVLKKGLAKDVKSHLCWHVYAMLAQMDRQWTEAVKCYRLALRADDKNVKMLRELASLLIQARDTAGYVDVRQKLFNLEPGNRVNWIALAVAHYLHGEFEATLKMLLAYEKATSDVPTEQHVKSEFQLFKNTVVERAKSADEALAHLEQVASLIPDKLTFKERKVELCLKAGKQDEAEKLYRELLELNPENYNYYAGLRKAMGLVPAAGSSLSEEQVSKLQVTFDQLQKLYPRANAPSRIALDFLEGEAFSAELANYVRPRLRSGKPSLFSELKSLYARAADQTFEFPDKVSRIEQQFEGYLTSLRTHKKFDAAEASEESPSTEVFTLHFAAQHFDAKRDFTRALELVQEGIAHTPTLVNLYVAKARILKHAGNHAEAAARMEVARKLDLADRYLNTVSTKYQLRAGLKEQAEATVSLFTKWDASGQNNLFEMQASWYELALAATYRRAGDLPNAVTQYTNVIKHFQDFDEDQLDFHAYCVRKQTLRAYLDLLRWEDNVHSHRFYYRAATNLVECYLEWLQEQDRLRERSSVKTPLDDSEEAKARRKQESKERRLKKREEETTSTPASAEETKEEKPSHAVPTDMSKVDALAEATKLVRVLEKSSADKLHTHVLAVQVYLRAGQYSAALSALKKAVALQPDHPDVHRSLIRLFHHAASAQQLSADAKKEVEEASASLLGGQSVEQANEAFLAKHPNSLAHLLAAADMKLLIGGPQKKSEAASLLRADATATLSELETAHQALVHKFEDSAAAEAFLKQAHQRFPLASAFAAAAPAAPESAEAQQ